jgi:hypothetical protein
MSWHADRDVLRAYEAGRLGDVRSLSLEAHLLGCEPCRRELAGLADRPRLDAVWERVSTSVEEPNRTAVERILFRVGVPAHLARLVAATPSLSGAWVLAVALTLAFAVIASNAGSLGAAVFLAFAPLLPITGVALAYGPWLDPVYELSVAAPMSSFKLLLLRASATFASTIVLAGAAALALPGPWWLAAAWLLPALALTVATLALGSYLSHPIAAGVVGLVWVAVVVLAPVAAAERLAVFRLGGQAACLAIALLATAVLVHRRGVFEDGRFDV